MDPPPTVGRLRGSASFLQPKTFVLKISLKKIIKYVKKVGFWAIGGSSRAKTERNEEEKNYKKNFFGVHFNWFLGHPTAYKSFLHPSNLFISIFLERKKS